MDLNGPGYANKNGLAACYCSRDRRKPYKHSTVRRPENLCPYPQTKALNNQDTPSGFEGMKLPCFRRHVMVKPVATFGQVVFHFSLVPFVFLPLTSQYQGQLIKDACHAKRSSTTVGGFSCRLSSYAFKCVAFNLAWWIYLLTIC